jgi:hypothetical protein
MKKIIALAVAAAVSVPAMADLSIGAGARYTVKNSGVTDSRVNVTFSGKSTAESGVFAAANATLQLATAGTVGQDGDRNIIVGNEMANIAFGATEPAGVYSKGTDTFRVAPVLTGSELQERVLGRVNENIVVNVTAVEGATIQFAGNVEEDDMRVVLGTSMGGVAVKAGIDMASSDASTSDAYQLMASTSVGGVGVAVSYESQDDALANSFANVGASYMGFSLNWERAKNNNGSADGLYGAYKVADTAGVPGLTTTIGAGSADNADSSYGVRLEYAF